MRHILEKRYLIWAYALMIKKTNSNKNDGTKSRVFIQYNCENLPFYSSNSTIHDKNWLWHLYFGDLNLRNLKLLVAKRLVPWLLGSFLLKCVIYKCTNYDYVLYNHEVVHNINININTNYLHTLKIVWLVITMT